MLECPAIQRLREERRSAETLIKAKAAQVYATFDASERTLVRFGMFPADKMRKLDAELLEMAAQDVFPGFDNCDLTRLAAVGIMDAANAGPDKLVV